jgi:hypothetical protein
MRFAELGAGLAGFRKRLTRHLEQILLRLSSFIVYWNRYATGSGEVVGGLIQDEAENCWLPKRTSGNETARKRV